MGQTGCKLDSRYKEHVRYITINNPQSVYSNRILSNTHENGPIVTTMTWLQPAQKGKRINTPENYYM
jgi:hypothetical protein